MREMGTWMPQTKKHEKWAVGEEAVEHMVCSPGAHRLSSEFRNAASPITTSRQCP